LETYNFRTGVFTPYLAKSVKVVDPRTVTVQLRPDAKFDNGQPVTSADAKASIETTAANFNGGKCNGCNPGIGLLKDVTVVDPTTFTLNFTQDATGVVNELLVGREMYIFPASNLALEQKSRSGMGRSSSSPRPKVSRSR